MTLTVRKVALVTGAGSGIGRAAARHLSAQGFAVGLLGRTESELNDVAREIGAASGSSKVLVADVADAADAQPHLGACVLQRHVREAGVDIGSVHGDTVPTGVGHQRLR